MVRTNPKSPNCAVGTDDGTVAMYNVVFSTVHGLFHDRWGHTRLSRLLLLAAATPSAVEICCRLLVSLPLLLLLDVPILSSSSSSSSCTCCRCSFCCCSLTALPLATDRYAYRENITDVIVQHLITDAKVRIHCR